MYPKIFYVHATLHWLKTLAFPSSQKCHNAPHAQGSIASVQMRQVFPSLSVQETEMSFYFKIRRATAAQSAVVKIDRAPCSSKQDRVEQLAVLLLPQGIQFAGEQQLRRKGERETGRLFITHHSTRKNKLNRHK